MASIERNRVRYWITILVLLVVGPMIPIQSQTAPATSPQAAFVAYRCEFQPETNSARIRAVLMGSDGLPIPRDQYTVALSAANSDHAVAPEKVVAAIVSTRPPLQMIIVLDITDTVPIAEIINAIGSQLMPQLEVLDEVALITFSADISSRTQFYTDKNRLISDHMTNLQTVAGENRLYDAVREAILEQPFNSDMRQVVLMITDSGRRETQPQTLPEAIIAEANDATVEVFSVGFYSRDKPDEAELLAIANGTGGYSWIYNDPRNTRATIEAAVGEYLDNFVQALNSEILITVDMLGQEPDANRRVTFNIAIDAENEIPLFDQISCPIEILNHSITFVDSFGEAPIVNPVDIGVSVESDMNLSETTVVFWVNDEIVQNSSEHTYRFDTPTMQPGTYTIGAQLRDKYNQELATTPTTITLNVQHMLELNVVEETRPDLTGVTRFEAIANANLRLPDVHFTIASALDPRQAYPLGDGPVPFAPDGTAVLVVDDMAATIKELFPNLPAGDSVQIRAFVPGPSPEDLELATSNKVTFIPAPPPEPATTLTLPARNTLPTWITIFLVTLNILLFRVVKRTRIRRLIHVADSHELSPHLMTVTVRRDSSVQSHTLTKKTVFIGRGSSNDINLGDDPNISRQHGVLMWRKEGWFYSNRKRQLRTRIDGRSYKGLVFRKLDPVTELEIGQTQLLFHANTQRDISDFITTNL